MPRRVCGSVYRLQQHLQHRVLLRLELQEILAIQHLAIRRPRRVEGNIHRFDISVLPTPQQVHHLIGVHRLRCTGDPHNMALAYPLHHLHRHRPRRPDRIRDDILVNLDRFRMQLPVMLERRHHCPGIVPPTDHRGHLAHAGYRQVGAKSRLLPGPHVEGILRPVLLETVHIPDEDATARTWMRCLRSLEPLGVVVDVTYAAGDNLDVLGDL